MTERQRLANRRAHETIAVEHEGQRYKIGLGREILARPDDIISQGGVAAPVRKLLFGPIAEVFLNAQQVNSQIDVLASDGAILMSMLLQYGCPATDIFHAMKRNPDGSPASPLGRAAAYLVEGE